MVSTGRHARRATGLTVAEGEESFTRTESVARWSREGLAAYEAEGEALPFVFFFFFFFDRCKVFQSGKTKLRTGEVRGFFFLPEIFGVILHGFCGAAVPRCAFSFFVHITYQNKKLSTLPGVSTYVRQPPAMRSLCGV